MVVISLFPLSIGKSDMWSLVCCYCWGNCTLIYYILYQAITFKQLSFFLHFHGGAFFNYLCCFLRVGVQIILSAHQTYLSWLFFVSPNFAVV